MPIEIGDTEPKLKPKATWLSRPIAFHSGRSKVTPHARMLFTERLALLLETGTALHPSLEALKKQTDNSAMAGIIDALLEDISAGQTFSHALAKHPEVFPSTYVNLVAASESGGFMHKVLQQLLEMDQKREELNHTLLMAATYPAFLMVFSTGVIVFVLTWVFPRFAKMFDSIGDRLPITTKALMLISDLIVNYWAGIVMFLVATATWLFRWSHSRGGKESLDAFKLRIPGVKKIFLALYLIRTLRVLSLSLSNGVSVMDALSNCRELVANAQFRKFLLHVEDTVREGKGIAAGFERSDYIPPIARQMIQTGEATGNLGLVMGRIANDMEATLTKQVKMLAKLAEPILLLGMGLVVGLIVSALILPIFKLSGAVR